MSSNRSPTNYSTILVLYSVRLVDITSAQYNLPLDAALIVQSDTRSTNTAHADTEYWRFAVDVWRSTIATQVDSIPHQGMTIDMQHAQIERCIRDGTRLWASVTGLEDHDLQVMEVDWEMLRRRADTVSPATTRNFRRPRASLRQNPPRRREYSPTEPSVRSRTSTPIRTSSRGPWPIEIPQSMSGPKLTTEHFRLLAPHHGAQLHWGELEVVPRGSSVQERTGRRATVSRWWRGSTRACTGSRSRMMDRRW